MKYPLVNHIFQNRASVRIWQEAPRKRLMIVNGRAVSIDCVNWCIHVALYVEEMYSHYKFLQSESPIDPDNWMKHPVFYANIPHAGNGVCFGADAGRRILSGVTHPVTAFWESDFIDDAWVHCSASVLQSGFGSRQAHLPIYQLLHTLDIYRYPNVEIAMLAHERRRLLAHERRRQAVVGTFAPLNNW